MDTVRIGSSGIEVSRFCMGAWNFAGGEGWGPEGDDASVRLMHHAFDSGCNFIDTARGYGRGHSEEVVGKGIKGRRDQVVVSSKLVHCPAEKVAGEVDTSLRLMQTDYIDLYICHWPSPSQSLDAFFEALVKEKERGKIREIGASNFDAAQLRTALKYGAVSLQPPFSILWRIPDDTLAFCTENNIAITPYSPLAQGMLTGRYTRGESEVTGIRRNNQLYSELLFPRALDVCRKVDTVADRLGCTSAQVALAWLLKTPGVTAPIVGSSSTQQWDQNMGALSVELSQDDYDMLDREGRTVWDLLGPDESMWGWKPS